jgi:hypothetical protein
MGDSGPFGVRGNFGPKGVGGEKGLKVRINYKKRKLIFINQHIK